MYTRIYVNRGDHGYNIKFRKEAKGVIISDEDRWDAGKRTRVTTEDLELIFSSFNLFMRVLHKLTKMNTRSGDFGTAL